MLCACVDLGGTKVSVSLAHTAAPGDTDLSAEARLPRLLASRAEPTVKTGAPDAVPRQILRLIEAACHDAGASLGQIAAVGVAAPGPFRMDAAGQVELVTPNLCGALPGSPAHLGNDWTHIAIEAELRRAFEHVRVENDAVAALAAEQRWGALQGLRHCAYVTWSTGVGVGLCVDGRVLRGKNGNAGHAGHSFVDRDNDAACGCGQRGDVESLIAGSAIPRRFGMSAAELLGAAARGEPQALAHAERLCHILQRMLLNLTATLDLEGISLGGSVFWHHREWLLPRLQLSGRTGLAAVLQGVRVMPAGLRDRVGEFGAVAVAVRAGREGTIIR